MATETQNTIGEFTTNVKGCARCDADHDGMEFAKLAKPVLGDGTGYGASPALATHWSTCPTTKEPLLLNVISSESQS